MIMPVDLSQCLVIGVSSRALFDLEEANQVYQTEGVDAYARFQLDHVDEILAPGTGFPLIQAILRLNDRKPDTRLAEVVIVSKNNPATSLRLVQRDHPPQARYSASDPDGRGPDGPLLARLRDGPVPVGLAG